MEEKRGKECLNGIQLLVTSVHFRIARWFERVESKAR
jgi:hypothetical protein